MVPNWRKPRSQDDFRIGDMVRYKSSFKSSFKGLSPKNYRYGIVIRISVLGDRDVWCVFHDSIEEARSDPWMEWDAKLAKADSIDDMLASLDATWMDWEELEVDVSGRRLEYNERIEAALEEDF